MSRILLITDEDIRRYREGCGGDNHGKENQRGGDAGGGAAARLVDGSIGGFANQQRWLLQGDTIGGEGQGRGVQRGHQGEGRQQFPGSAGQGGRAFSG